MSLRPDEIALENSRTDIEDEIVHSSSGVKTPFSSGSNVKDIARTQSAVKDYDSSKSNKKLDLIIDNGVLYRAKENTSFNLDNTSNTASQPSGNFPSTMLVRQQGTILIESASGGNTLETFTLTTPRDITTRTLLRTWDSGDRFITGITFSNNGKFMYILDALTQRVYQYSLQTPYVISNDIGAVTFVTSFSVSTEQASPRGITLAKDDITLVVVGLANDNLQPYTFTAANDLSVAPTPGTPLSVIGYTSFDTGSISDVRFTKENDRIFFVSNGPTNNRLHETKLPTPGILTGGIEGKNTGVGGQDISPVSFDLDELGILFWMMGTATNSYYEYSTVGPFDLTQWDPISSVPESSCLLVKPTVALGGPPDTATLGPCQIIVVDNFSTEGKREIFLVDFPGVTDTPITNIATEGLTQYRVDRFGALSENNSQTPSGSIRRNTVAIALFNHPDGVVSAFAATSEVGTGNNAIASNTEFMALTGGANAVRKGMFMTGSATLQQANIGAGDFVGRDINRINDPANADTKFHDTILNFGARGIFRTTTTPQTTSILTPFNFTGGVFDDINNLPILDAGTEPDGLANPAKFGYHQIFRGRDSGEIFVSWGQDFSFDTIDDAETAYKSTPYTIPVSIEGAVPIGGVIMLGSPTVDMTNPAQVRFSEAGIGAGSGGVPSSALFHSFGVVMSDESSELIKNSKTTIMAERSGTLTDLIISLNTATAPSGTLLTVAVKRNGVLITPTPITIDAGVSDSRLAVTPVVINDPVVALGDLYEFEIIERDDDLGTSLARGLKAYALEIL